MKILRRLFKWIGILLASLFILVIWAGFTFRVMGPAPHGPKGELVDVGGFHLHINAAGEKGNAPTVVIEGGGGLTTEFYHWLNEGLKDSLRVVRYDRAGLGHSDECSTPRDPETIAHELHTLLTQAGEEPPYVLVGHSLGGPYIRVFTQLYPEEVAGLFFLDATHHNHVALFNAPKETSFKMKAYLWTLGAQAVLADMGVIALYDRLFEIPYFGEGLPDSTNSQIKKFLGRGKLIRGYKEEIAYYHATLKRSAEANDFGALPIRAFTAAGIHEEPYRAHGIAPAQEFKGGPHPHGDFAALSTNGKHIFLYGNHVTIFSKKENAAIICEEIRQVINGL